MSILSSPRESFGWLPAPIGFSLAVFGDRLSKRVRFGAILLMSWPGK